MGTRLSRGARRLTVALIAIPLALAATAGPVAAERADSLPFAPVDPQRWQNPDAMTWADYKPIPGTFRVNEARKPTRRTFRGALVLGDYRDRRFAVTQPLGANPYGNPRADLRLARNQVPAFFRDFLNKPQPLNHGLTVNGYWMENSAGQLGVELDSYGVYELPGKAHEYGLNEFGERPACPKGDSCTRSPEADLQRLWESEQGRNRRPEYDFVFYLTAGEDESSTWQEFGPMRFRDPADITPEFGPPGGGDRSAPTRYVKWTSWAAASNVWPRADKGRSLQAESSGLSTYAHEFSHILNLGDNYNNPFSVPARRAYAGVWDMMDRGTFNGPGGPHTRFHIPPTQGSAVGVHHQLRNKRKLGIVADSAVLRLSRQALASSGVLVATVTAREVTPEAGSLSGVNVAMDADHSPRCDTTRDPRCDGGGYDNYTVEVVDRIGYDSFTPDSGVLLAKTKNADNAPFAWTVDANPQDIGLTDFTRPDGTPVKITVGDYRQSADALFKAGTGSGSRYEWVDQANRLHFYVLDVRREAGVLRYRVAARSLDGAGPHTRGVRVEPGTATGAVCTFPLANTGQVRPFSNGHPQDVAGYARSDVYRLSASATAGRALLPREVVDVAAGAGVPVRVVLEQAPAGTEVELTAVSESDPTRRATARCRVGG